MKISSFIKSLEVYNNNTSKDKNIKKTSQEVASNDNFSLSSEARDYQTVYKALADTPDIRMDKVNSIKAQMDAGTYFVSSKAIANKILSN